MYSLSFQSIFLLFIELILSLSFSFILDSRRVLGLTLCLFGFILHLDMLGSLLHCMSLSVTPAFGSILFHVAMCNVSNFSSI